ncbi:MAG: DUF2693 domain-containing protein [Prevotella sp.]|nr:DUF2693 domain-containing protein [Prevotella sp.]
MKATFKTTLQKVMNLAWQFIKKNGMTLSEALKVAWLNIKLRAQMQTRIVKFHFQKVDGSIREAYGTLQSSFLPATKGTGRTPNETLQTYFDTEKQEYRCFKKANLISVTL